MTSALRRYEFSERLADILGFPRRDLRYRVTLLVAGGIVPPGPRGPGSPPATPEYASTLLIGAMAAPQQAQTVEAIECYRALKPVGGAEAPGVVVRGAGDGLAAAEPEPPAALGRLCFGDALAALIERGRDPETAAALAAELFGVWVGRGFPAAAVQLASAEAGRRAVVTRRYELPAGARPPAWLDPGRGGAADPGLLHTVFLPAAKLIEIGGLVAPSDRRRPPMLGIDDTLAGLAKLATRKTDRGRWERFLETARAARAFAEKVDARGGRLVAVADFGANPGGLRMFKYVPPGLRAGAPLVVVLHGCTQSAQSYDHGTGWTTLADRHGFAVLLPQQGRANNPLRCFNWFRAEDFVRDGGEAESIRRMIERMLAEHALDRSRVFVTGVSAGGAMTSVMLATHPELFAGGAVVAGVPYGAAEGLQDAFEAIFQGPTRPDAGWASEVERASAHGGPWPRVSVWHGEADGTVKPSNAEAVVEQWAALHGLAGQPTIETRVDGARRRVWQDAAGEDRIEAFTIPGMAHGVPISASGPHACGNPGPFILDVGVSSTHHIARFWGLTEGTAAAPEPEPTPRHEPRPDGDAPVVVARPDPGGDRGETRTRRGPRPRDGAGLDVQGVIAKAFEIAGAAAAGGRGPDIGAILGKSFELADMVATGKGGARAPDGGLAAAGWTGEGWTLVADAADAPGGGPVLHGAARSGTEGGVGETVRTIARPIAFGTAPRLRYLRRLELSAAANMLTRARFRVLIDGEVVDEVAAVGMRHDEAEWTERTLNGLERFAGRTVPVAFEVAANANVFVEVFARAWIAGVTVEDGAAAD